MIRPGGVFFFRSCRVRLITSKICEKEIFLKINYETLFISLNFEDTNEVNYSTIFFELLYFFSKKVKTNFQPAYLLFIQYLSNPPTTYSNSLNSHRKPTIYLILQI